MSGIFRKISSSLSLPTTLDLFVRWAVFLLIIYWFVFALLAPVTVWDSHTYNLARLTVAERNGLFSNTLWTSERQVMFPWSFDAIHLLFLSLGWGYDLPSYACLLGIAWILFQVFYPTSPRIAWLMVLSLFAMPTVIFQATSTKNDIGLVFVALFAAYSLFRFREQMNPQWLFLSAIAIGFLPGIKSSGLPLAFFLIVATFWFLRGQHRLLAGWIIATTTSFCLLGSLEIYINNVLIYGNLLGEPTFISWHQNHDGVAGTVANTIRYVVGLINPGSQPSALVPSWQINLESACRDLLQALDLTNKGYRSDFSDESMKFWRIGQEASSDFGSLGTAAMILSALQVLTFRKNQPACWIALSGWALLLVTAATVGWMPWNMRFLMLPVILFVAASLMTLTQILTQRPWIYAGIIVFILYGAIVYPLYSFNKTPVDLINAVRHREATTLKERSSMQEVFDAVRKFHADAPATPWLLHAGSDSWVLGLLEMPDVKFTLAPQLETNSLNAAAAASPTGEVFILVLNRAWTHPATTVQAGELILFKGEISSGIYSWRSPIKVQLHSQRN